MNNTVDIIIDTNVFEHTSNPKVKYYHSSNCVLKKICESPTLLCLDEGYDPIEALNRSWISREYIERLRRVSSGYTYLLLILNQKKYKIIERSKYRRHMKTIGRKISDQTDRHFICVAFESTGKIFISNDYQDFPLTIRKECKNKHMVNILNSTEFK
jgi:hypothetical protein